MVSMARGEVAATGDGLDVVDRRGNISLGRESTVKPAREPEPAEEIQSHVPTLVDAVELHRTAAKQQRWTSAPAFPRWKEVVEALQVRAPDEVWPPAMARPSGDEVTASAKALPQRPQ